MLVQNMAHQLPNCRPNLRPRDRGRPAQTAGPRRPVRGRRLVHRPSRTRARSLGRQRQGWRPQGSSRRQGNGTIRRDHGRIGKPASRGRAARRPGQGRPGLQEQRDGGPCGRAPRTPRSCPRVRLPQRPACAAPDARARAARGEMQRPRPACCRMSRLGLGRPVAARHISLTNAARAARCRQPSAPAAPGAQQRHTHVPSTPATRWRPATRPHAAEQAAQQQAPIGSEAETTARTRQSAR